MGHEAFAAVWAKGRALTMEQAIEYALTWYPFPSSSVPVMRVSSVLSELWTQGRTLTVGANSFYGSHAVQLESS